MNDTMLVETLGKTNLSIKEKVLELLRLKHMLKVFVGVGISPQRIKHKDVAEVNHNYKKNIVELCT